jgi:hypothetical protein
MESEKALLSWKSFYNIPHGKKDNSKYNAN